MRILYFIKIVFFSFLMFYQINAQKKIIKAGDLWSYYDDALPPNEDWYKVAFLAEDWKSGNSPLGYGSEIIQTVTHFGSDPENKQITTYFKKTFVLDNPYLYLTYKLNVHRDDGIVVYINGKEITRNNMPSGIITHETEANHLVFNDSSEKLFHSLLLSPDDFVEGENIISASVHQARKTSSDAIFNLELIGVNDSAVIPLLQKEQSIKNLSLELKLKEINHKLEVENKDVLLEMIENSKKTYEALVYVLSFFLLFTLISFLYLRNLSLNKKRDLKKKGLYLKDQIKDKNQELLSISLNCYNDYQLIKEIKRRLEEVVKRDYDSLKKETKNIINQIAYNLKDNEKWENLKNHFNTVHSDFFVKLSQFHPSLTEVELRHCAFIKLYMQTKEIASALHIGSRSVQTSRHRIKKKMGLDEKTDLRSYLLNI